MRSLSAEENIAQYERTVFFLIEEIFLSLILVFSKSNQSKNYKFLNLRLK